METSPNFIAYIKKLNIYSTNGVEYVLPKEIENESIIKVWCKNTSICVMCESYKCVYWRYYSKINNNPSMIQVFENISYGDICLDSECILAIRNGETISLLDGNGGNKPKPKELLYETIVGSFSVSSSHILGLNNNKLIIYQYKNYGIDLNIPEELSHILIDKVFAFYEYSVVITYDDKCISFGINTSDEYFYKDFGVCKMGKIIYLNVKDIVMKYFAILKNDSLELIYQDHISMIISINNLGINADTILDFGITSSNVKNQL